MECWVFPWVFPLFSETYCWFSLMPGGSAAIRAGKAQARDFLVMPRMYGTCVVLTLWSTNSLLLKMAIYSWFTHKKMVLSHSYVSLPEGSTYPTECIFATYLNSINLSIRCYNFVYRMHNVIFYAHDARLQFLFLLSTSRAMLMVRVITSSPLKGFFMTVHPLRVWRAFRELSSA